MFKQLAYLVTTYPIWVLGFWVVVVTISLPLATKATGVMTGQPTAPQGSTGSKVRDTLAKDFATRNRFEAVIVAKSRNAQVGEADFDGPYASTLDPALELLGIDSIQDHRNAAWLPLISPDRRIAIALISFEALNLLEAKKRAKALRELLHESRDLEFSVAGGPATLQELEEISERDTRRAELFGLPLSLGVLVVAFGALVASGLPLLVAVASITISFALLFLIGSFYTFAVFTQSFVTMLGLATGIDYALLMVSRFREELRISSDPREAARKTSVSAGRAVVFSGLTVIIALAALLITPLPFIQSMGVGSVIVITVSVLVAITALPAAMVLLGHRINWLKVTRQEPGMRTRSFWERRAGQIMARPWLWASGGAVVLILLNLPVLHMQVADPGGRGLSVLTDARKTVEALAAVGLEGLLDPIDVLVDLGDRGFYHPSSVRTVSNLGRALEKLDSVGGVFTATSTPLPTILTYQYYANRTTALSSPLADLVAATVSDSGRYALLRVYPTEAITPREGNLLIRQIEEMLVQSATEAMVGGAFVLDQAWNSVLYRSFPISLTIVYLLTMILLGLAFHSILIPLKAIVLNTLTVGATYGVITLVFQDGVFSNIIGLGSGLGFVDNSAPLFIFAIVFGLSMDYEVFLVSRFFEAHRRGMSDREAVKYALSTTGGVITSAASVMIVVFSLFIFSDVVLIKTLGVGLVVAIFLDATLVRVALAPAVMTLAGHWNWRLPQPVSRLFTRLGIYQD